VKLIPSIAGKHEGWPAVIQTGHTRLMKAVRDLGLRTGKGKAARELALECQVEFSIRIYYSLRVMADWVENRAQVLEPILPNG
jgi:tyrosyl-DNA phosphodiesterase-1